MIRSNDAAQILLDSLRWIDSTQGSEVDLPADQRHLLGLAATDLAIEHASAVLRLTWVPEGTQPLCGAAMALLRPMFEALVRSWLILFVLGDAEVGRAAAGGRLPKATMKERVQQVEAVADLRHDGFMSRIVSDESGIMDMLHGFTHGGFEQLRRRIKCNQIGPRYSDEDKARTMLFAALLAIIAWIVVCRMSNRLEACAAGEARLDQIAGRLNEAGASIRTTA